jgi:hypothetical protein
MKVETRTIFVVEKDEERLLFFDYYEASVKEKELLELDCNESSGRSNNTQNMLKNNNIGFPPPNNININITISEQYIQGCAIFAYLTSKEMLATLSNNLERAIARNFDFIDKIKFKPSHLLKKKIFAIQCTLLIDKVLDHINHTHKLEEVVQETINNTMESLKKDILQQAKKG